MTTYSYCEKSCTDLVERETNSSEIRKIDLAIIAVDVIGILSLLAVLAGIVYSKLQV